MVFKTNPKILFVIGSFGVGGAELQMLMLVHELIKRNWKCEIFVLEANGPLREFLHKEKIVFYDGGINSYSSIYSKIFQLIRAFLLLWRIAVRTKPNILHAYLPLTNFLGALAARAAGVPYVITSKRALGTHQDRYSKWRMFDRLASLLSNRITANSSAVAEDTIKRDHVNREKISIIYNGIDIARFKRPLHERIKIRTSFGLANEEIGVITVGNLIPYKGHRDLINALPCIQSQAKIKAKYFFVGEDRGIGNSLNELLHAQGLSGSVTFLGRRSDVAELMGAMDIFVLPSHEEGFSNALLEAMASGLAVVATNVGGNPEALECGQNGLLVSPYAPVELAEAVLKLISDSRLRNHLGSRARSAVQGRYSINAMVNAHIALYQNQPR